MFHWRRGNISLEAPIIEYLIQNEGFTIPSGICNDKLINELESRLEIGNIYQLAKFFENVSVNIEDYFERELFDNFMISITETKNILDNNFDSVLTADDIIIINFLCKIGSPGTDFLEISGPLYSISEVVRDIYTYKQQIPETVIISALLYIYVNILEITLHYIDRRLVIYLNENLSSHEMEKKPYDRFLNKQKDRDNFHEHAMAGTIYEVLKKLLNLKNNSVFNHGSKSRKMRNKISHSNLFYDSNRKMIVTLSGENISFDQFLEEFNKLFLFYITWFESSINACLNEEYLYDLMMKDIADLYAKTGKILRKYDRADYQRRFGRIIVQIKNKQNIL